MIISLLDRTKDKPSQAFVDLIKTWLKKNEDATYSKSDMRALRNISKRKARHKTYKPHHNTIIHE